MSALDKMAQAVAQRHSYARDWKKRTGGKVMGYFCTYFPEEVVYAAGILPVRILGSHEPQDITERHIYSKWCPPCRDILAQGLLGRYDYLDGVLQGHCCIHMKQAFVAWRLHAPVSYSSDLYVPAYLQSPLARPNLIQGIEEVRRSLEEAVGHPISPTALRQAIEVFNTNRRLLGELYSLRKGEAQPFSAGQVMTAVLSTMVMDKAESNQLLRQWLGEVQSKPNGRPGGIRLMLIGSGNDDLAFLEMVESLSNVAVVVDDHCIGTRYFFGEVPDGQDPVAAIAERYIIKPPCPNKDLIYKKRIEHIVGLARDYRVQGAIVLQQKFCDPHAWDAPDIKTGLEKLGVPVLFLESDVVVPAGQFRTRVEAFLEMIEMEA